MQGKPINQIMVGDSTFVEKITCTNQDGTTVILGEATIRPCNA